MILRTAHCAIWLHKPNEYVKAPWTPYLYPGFPLKGCERFNPTRAFSAALSRLDQLDQEARQALDIRPLPNVEQGAYDHIPEGEFEDCDGEV